MGDIKEKKKIETERVCLWDKAMGAVYNVCVAPRKPMIADGSAMSGAQNKRGRQKDRAGREICYSLIKLCLQKCCIWPNHGERESETVRDVENYPNCIYQCVCVPVAKGGSLKKEEREIDRYDDSGREMKRQNVAVLADPTPSPG